MSRTKVVAIIQSRMTSKRLPGKVMKKLVNKTVLQCVVDRVKAVNTWGKLIDKIVVATPEMYPLLNENDVLSRYYECAKENEATHIVRITSDCPFLDPILVTELIRYCLRNELNYCALPLNRGAIPDGYDAEFFTFEKLEEAHKKCKKKKWREDVTTWIRNSLPFADCQDMELEDMNFKKYKLSLDTKEDYRRLKKYAELLSL